jgi:hypothetical protein
VFEVGGVEAGGGVGEAADGIGDDVATEPPVLHPATKASSTSPAANSARIALKVKRLNYRFGYAHMRIFGPSVGLPGAAVDSGGMGDQPRAQESAVSSAVAFGRRGWRWRNPCRLIRRPRHAQLVRVMETTAHHS